MLIDTSVESVMNTDILCTDVVGLIGEPNEIETTSEFDTATLTFTIDKSKLGKQSLTICSFCGIMRKKMILLN